MSRITRTISVDKENFEKAGEILKEIGLTRSRFIDLTFKGLVESKKKPFQIIQEELVQGMLHDANVSDQKELRGGYRGGRKADRVPGEVKAQVKTKAVKKKKSEP